jgi:hypothetical protein
LCLVCETLIAHESEVDRVVNGLAQHAAAPATYLVLGTLGSETWRNGMSGTVTIEDVKHDRADFKAYMRLEITPRHGIPNNDPED